MTPSNVILNALQDLLAQDPTTLAPVANALQVHLAKAAFTPAPNRIVADFTEAAFVGATAKPAGLGACQEFFDSPSGNRVIQLNEPAGGWHWLCTSLTGLPETIFGFYVTDLAGTVLYGCQQLPTPVTISIIGQAIDLPWIRLTFAPLPLN